MQATLRRHASSRASFSPVRPRQRSPQSIRDRIRLSRDKLTPITEAQANELTLTLNDAAVRPIQIWVRTAGTIDAAATHHHRHAFRRARPATSKSASASGRFRPSRGRRCFRRRSRGWSPQGDTTSVTAALSGPAHDGQLTIHPRNRHRADRVLVRAERGDHRVGRQARRLRPGGEGALRAARDSSPVSRASCIRRCWTG